MEYRVEAVDSNVCGEQRRERSEGDSEEHLFDVRGWRNEVEGAGDCGDVVRLDFFDVFDGLCCAYALGEGCIAQLFAGLLWVKCA